MRNLDRSRRYTKTQGVTCNSSNLKPKRTGHMDTWGRKETVKIEAMKEHFEPKDRKKKRCSKDSTGAPQKQRRGTGIPKDIRC